MGQMGFTAVGDKKRILSAIASLSTVHLEAHTGNFTVPSPVNRFGPDVGPPQVSDMMMPLSVDGLFAHEMCSPPSWDACPDPVAPVAPPVVRGWVAQEVC